MHLGTILLFFSLLGVVAGQLEDFGGEVLEDGGQVHWGAGADSLGVSALSEESGDSSDWEVETSLAGSGGLLAASCLSLSLSLSTDGHFELMNYNYRSRFILPSNTPFN
jgi:hypothetical protein